MFWTLFFFCGRDPWYGAKLPLRPVCDHYARFLKFIRENAHSTSRLPLCPENRPVYLLGWKTVPKSLFGRSGPCAGKR